MLMLAIRGENVAQSLANYFIRLRVDFHKYIHIIHIYNSFHLFVNVWIGRSIQYKLFYIL